MKYSIAIGLLVAMASARMVKPVGSELAELQEIIASFNSPSTDVLGIKPELVDVGPAIVDADLQPIAIGPAVMDFPHPDGTLAEEPVIPGSAVIAAAPAKVPPGAPVAPVGPVPPVGPAAPTAPLVQIILHINQVAAGASPVSVGLAVGPAVGPAVDPAVDRPVPEASLPNPVHPIDVGAPEPVKPIKPVPEVGLAPRV